MKSDRISHSRLKELLSYEEETGLFRWKVRTSNRIEVGRVAGTVALHGYIHVHIDGKLYLAHRLAWFYVNGEWPPHQVDHKDQCRSNNALSNLRLATPSQNGCNSVARSPKSGIKGVSWSKVSGKWAARIIVSKVFHHLGLFDCKDEAAAVVAEARNRLHGEFANHG